MTDLLCRCPGLEGDCPCETEATQEDGLCDGCRCEHGCCVDHGHPMVDQPWEKRLELMADFDRWTETTVEAYRVFHACKGRRVERKVIAET